MSIADKLATIAENMQRVYEAGRISNIDIRTIDFGLDGFSGIGSTPMVFEHGLGKEPKFAAIFADDVEAVKSATLPTGISAIIVQTDRFETNPSTYLRYANGAIVAGAVTDTTRLITKWDDENVYVNSAAATYAFPSSTITTFTMICVA